MKYLIESKVINIMLHMRDLYLKILYNIFRTHTLYNNLKHTYILRACFITYYGNNLEFDPYMIQSFVESWHHDDIRDLRIVTFQYKISRREDRIYRERN